MHQNIKPDSAEQQLFENTCIRLFYWMASLVLIAIIAQFSKMTISTDAPTVAVIFLLLILTPAIIQGVRIILATHKAIKEKIPTWIMRTVQAFLLLSTLTVACGSASEALPQLFGFQHSHLLSIIQDISVFLMFLAFHYIGNTLFLSGCLAIVLSLIAATLPTINIFVPTKLRPYFNNFVCKVMLAGVAATTIGAIIAFILLYF